MPKPITRAIVLQHVPHEGPGRIGSMLAERGVRVEILRLDQGAAVPAELPEDTLLVVMGGPMGVGDVGDPRYPFLAAEIALLKTCIERDQPVIGVCLGFQLIAAAAGARVYPHVTGDPPQRCREVGWGAVTFLPRTAEEPLLAGLDQSEVVLHWHGDTCDLPEGAQHLASTLACPLQMFRLKRRIIAMQFHIEVDAAVVAGWVADDAEFVRAAGGADHGQRILADTQRFAPRHRRVGDRLIGNILHHILG